MAGADTLLLLSGGIDSAWCLLQRVRAGLPTRTHHVVLSDWEGRAGVESRAVAQVLSWFHTHGGEGLIDHTESRVDFQDLRWIPKNYYLWAYWAGTIMAAPAGRKLTTLILPRHSDAFPDGPDAVGAQLSDRAYIRTIELIAGRTPTLSYPMLHLTKAEVVRSMPGDLLPLCWWCRTPRGGSPCHSCRTCQQVDAAL